MSKLKTKSKTVVSYTLKMNSEEHLALVALTGNVDSSLLLKLGLSSEQDDLITALYMTLDSINDGN